MLAGFPVNLIVSVTRLHPVLKHPLVGITVYTTFEIVCGNCRVSGSSPGVTKVNMETNGDSQNFSGW